MITYMITAAGLIVVTGFLHVAFNKEHRYEAEMPQSLTSAELWRNGTRLMYMHNGEWCEAIAKTKDKVFIFDEGRDKIIGVPLINE